jgi:hypothetical protein
LPIGRGIGERLGGGLAFVEPYLGSARAARTGSAEGNEAGHADGLSRSDPIPLQAVPNRMQAFGGGVRRRHCFRVAAVVRFIGKFW